MSHTTPIHHSTTQYLGFGLSGSNTATSMFQADATIAWVDDNGMPQARDYYLSDYVQVCFTLHNVSVPLILIACLLTLQYNTVEPPNKEHVGDNICFVLYREIVLF